jgi:hypothetical protein
VLGGSGVRSAGLDDTITSGGWIANYDNRLEDLCKRVSHSSVLFLGSFPNFLLNHISNSSATRNIICPSLLSSFAFDQTRDTSSTHCSTDLYYQDVNFRLIVPRSIGRLIISK